MTQSLEHLLLARMSNVLSQHKQQTVIALGRLGWSLRRIEQETGVRRETAGAYLRAAGVAVREPRRRSKPASNPPPDPGVASAPEGQAQPTVEAKPASNPPPDSDEPKPASPPNPPPDSDEPKPASPPNPPPNSGEPKPASPPNPPPDSGSLRPGPSSACEPYRELIETWLELGRNGKAIWQELVDRHGFTARYDSVKRFLRVHRTRQGPKAHPTITTEPGEEAQVDYGQGPLVRHPETGQYRRPRLFVLTLGYSRKSVRLLTWRSSAQIWAQLHERAFRRLGGVPRLIVLDNLREGVIKPDLYDPELNPLYRDVLRHYGATALPCRVEHPDRKGKVESGIGHTQETPLKGRRFESIEESQDFLDHWEERWADTRIHGTTKRQVAEMFEEERGSLLPLPLEPFRYYRFASRVVHLDGCVEVDKRYFMAPPGRIGSQLRVQWDGSTVRLLDPRTGELLVEHDRHGHGRHRVREELRPPRTPLEVERLLARAEIAGQSLGALCRAIHDREAELGVRRILGVLSLAKKHGPAAVDEACRTALEVGAPTYRCVRRLLERRPEAALLRQVDPLIRDLTHYRDLFQQRTGGPT